MKLDVVDCLSLRRAPMSAPEFEAFRLLLVAFEETHDAVIAVQEAQRISKRGRTEYETDQLTAIEQELEDSEGEILDDLTDVVLNFPHVVSSISVTTAARRQMVHVRKLISEKQSAGD